MHSSERCTYALDIVNYTVRVALMYHTTHLKAFLTSLRYNKASGSHFNGVSSYFSLHLEVFKLTSYGKVLETFFAFLTVE